MKKLSLLIVIFGSLYLSLDFYLNAGYYGYKLNERGHPNIAIKVWQVGAFVGDDESKLQLGMAYWVGKFVEEDYDKAFELLAKIETISPKVVSRYEYALADIYIYKGNIAKAKEMFQFSCANKLKQACIKLNQMITNE